MSIIKVDYGTVEGDTFDISKICGSGYATLSANQTTTISTTSKPKYILYNALYQSNGGWAGIINVDEDTRTQIGMFNGSFQSPTYIDLSGSVISNVSDSGFTFKSDIGTSCMFLIMAFSD